MLNACQNAADATVLRNGASNIAEVQGKNIIQAPTRRQHS